jgi:hypothetical protein
VKLCGSSYLDFFTQSRKGSKKDLFVLYFATFAPLREISYGLKKHLIFLPQIALLNADCNPRSSARTCGLLRC